MILSGDRTAEVAVHGRRASERQVDGLVDGPSSPGVAQRRRLDEHATVELADVVCRQPPTLRHGRAEPAELELMPTVAGRRRAVGGAAPVSYTHLTLPTIYSV